MIYLALCSCYFYPNRWYCIMYYKETQHHT